MPFTRSIVGGGGMFTLTMSCRDNFVGKMDLLIGSTTGTTMEGTLFGSSSSLLGSCGKAGFNGIAWSSFGLMEKDTEAVWMSECNVEFAEMF